MNLNESRYSQYTLAREMMDTVDVVKGFDSGQTEKVAAEIKAAGRLFLTGEGSINSLEIKFQRAMVQSL